jgi:VanZ family protein
MQRVTNIATLLAFAFIVVVIYSANSGSELIRGLSGLMPYFDKLAHGVIFGSFTLLAILALRCRTIRIGPAKLYLGFICVAIFVVAEELSQIFIETRSFDLLDLLADFIGMLSAALLVSVIRRRYQKESAA